MRTLFARGTEHQDGRIVLLGEKLERRSVFEGVDGVLFCEFLGEWNT